MNEKVKSFFKKVGGYIIAFLGGIIAIILGTVLQNKRDGADRTGELAEDARGEAKRAGDSVKRSQELNRELQEDNGRMGEILKRVRERPITGTEEE